MGPPTIRSWQDLEVWQKAHEMTLRVYRRVHPFPPEERFRLTDPLCRAAASIPTNIAEGKGRHALGDSLRFLCIARGSTAEVQYLLRLAHDLGYLSKSEYEEFVRGYDIVGKMLNRLMAALRRRHPNTQHPTPNTQHPTPNTEVSHERPHH